MKIFVHHLCIVFICMICLNACNSTRTAPAAPSFEYQSQPSLRSDMQQFAYQMQLLHQTMTDSSLDQNVQQQEVLTTLRRLETIATDVGSSEHKASHPFLENYLGDFNIRLDHAISAAEANPPSYYLAGQITGGCISCHWVRDHPKPSNR